VSARYEFIDAEQATTTLDGARKYPILKMCEWLEVSTSGYYEWRNRPESATAQRRERLKILIAQIFDDSDETYGHRRIHAALARQGEHCSVELVRGLMRELRLIPCQPRPWRHSLTDADDQPAPIPDLVRRDFSAQAPGSKMVGDITYIPTWEGWVYLATVIDCYTKAVIGWATGDNYKTPLITAAITMAARNHTISSGAIFHSDRGSNPGFKGSSQHCLGSDSR
jgi:putative transposase